MITTLLFDFSKVILFAKDKEYKDDLNPLHKKLLEKNPNYNFLEHFELNEELLNFLETIKDKFEIYVFTSGSVQNAKEIKPRIDGIFKKIFSAEDLGLSKKESTAYLEIAKKLNKTPQEILFIDDSQTNIQAASEAGLNTFQYLNNESLIEKIKST